MFGLVLRWAEPRAWCLAKQRQRGSDDPQAEDADISDDQKRRLAISAFDRPMEILKSLSQLIVLSMKAVPEIYVGWSVPTTSRRYCGERFSDTPNFGEVYWT